MWTVLWKDGEKDRWDRFETEDEFVSFWFHVPIDRKRFGSFWTSRQRIQMYAKGMHGFSHPQQMTLP